MLKQQGYRFIHLNAILGPCVTNRHADVSYESGVLSVFMQNLLMTTALRRAAMNFYAGQMRRTMPQSFRTLTAVAAQRDAAPRFIMAHIISPHPPYLFDAAGNESSKPSFDWKPQHRYIGQLQYVSSLFLKLAAHIQLNAARPTVIIVQGDHGPGTLFERQDWSRPSMAQIRERSSILNACWSTVPFAGFTDTSSPVNTFRLLAPQLFGCTLPLLPDRTYYTPYNTNEAPFDVTDLVRRVE
ncbi:MAG TPA: sulfatase-like hydrolase/transferase [bacterium]|nr:sulfatase-like hydrolase/transferase [bacterium]